MRKTQTKGIFFLFFALFLFFLLADFAHPAPADSANITAIGVEKNNGEFFLSFSVPTSPAGDSIVLNTTDSTVAGCVEKISTSLGYTPKLAHTSLVIVHEELAQRDIFDAISFFLHTEQVHDSAGLLISRSLPSKVLLSKTQLEQTGVGAVSRLLEQSKTQKNAVAVPNIKDFAENYVSIGKDNILPLLEISPSKSTPSPSPPPSENTSAMPSSSPQGEGEDVVFDISKSSLFSNSDISATLEKDQTLGANILSGNAKNASFDVEIPLLSGETSTAHLSVASCKTDLKKEISNGTIHLKCEIKMTLGLLDQSKSSATLSQIAGLCTNAQAIATVAKTTIKDIATSTLDTAFSAKCDFLGIGEQLNRTDHENFQKLLVSPDFYLASPNLDVSVDISILQNYRL